MQVALQQHGAPDQRASAGRPVFHHRDHGENVGTAIADKVVGAQRQIGVDHDDAAIIYFQAALGIEPDMNAPFYVSVGLRR